MSRPRHPKKPVELAVQYAEKFGWTVELSNGHAWGRLYCPQSGRDGCQISVWSTPRVPENHARQIRGKVDGCPHVKTDGNDNEEQAS
ncbi:MAG: hypothetical protein JSS02_33365 [Planctomycetes bacterium]|nr:hypothetical protein [Planctomycetota bacterium]